MDREPLSHKEETCVALFHHFFHDVKSALTALAPEGWENSPLLRIFHPTPQQQYEEALRLHRNIEEITGESGKKPKSREPRRNKKTLCNRFEKFVISWQFKRKCLLAVAWIC